jgi:hypothetical protein
MKHVEAWPERERGARDAAEVLDLERDELHHLSLRGRMSVES